MPKLQVIVGTTRPIRAADRVVPWVVERAKAHGVFEVQVLDLRDWRLPFFQEHRGTIGDFSNPTYSDPVVRGWNHKVAEGDAFLIVSAEYNHSVPGELKNAIDSVWISLLSQQANRVCRLQRRDRRRSAGCRALGADRGRGRGCAAAQQRPDPVRDRRVRRGRQTEESGHRHRARNHARRPRLVLERPRTRPGRRGTRARRVPPPIRPRGFSKPPGMNLHYESSRCSHT
jgi:NAD(P)H-dependent FMN reductase